MINNLLLTFGPIVLLYKSKGLYSLFLKQSIIIFRDESKGFMILLYSFLAYFFIQGAKVPKLLYLSPKTP